VPRLAVPGSAADKPDAIEQQWRVAYPVAGRKADNEGSPVDRQLTATIRHCQPADLEDLYRICLQTADSGEDATALFSDPHLAGDVFAVPYAVLEPSLAFVAQDELGVCGYIVAALDTRAFEERLEREWWPAMRVKYPEPTPGEVEALPKVVRYAVQDIHHPWHDSDELVQPYPSHLHIDLLPRAQGRGVGRELINTLTAALRKQGSQGLHLFVTLRNTRAIGFYDHVGFNRLPGVDDVGIFVMDLSRPPES
jgi:ribosomal protein S18 acetylase RimI-like enzyme